MTADLVDPSDLAGFLCALAKHGNDQIRIHFPERFPNGQIGDAATLCVAEEAGEFVKAYRRWRGYSRTPGDFDSMADELADVVISAFFAADDYGIDLPARIRATVQRILTRGWRLPPVAAAAGVPADGARL